MKLVVNHLTRMQAGYICVAGIDMGTMQHVRPVLAGSRLSTALLKRNGGPFDIAAVVDLGAVAPAGHRPEVEDHKFRVDQAVADNDMSPKRFWKTLEQCSKRTLHGIFGTDLRAQRNGCAVDESSGSASLGCLVPASRPAIFVNSWEKVRALVSDGTLTVDLSVTDLRFYKDDHKTPQLKVIDDVQKRITAGVPAILSVGLARAFQATGDTARRHWLQLNNVHLADDPTWQLA